MYTPSKSLSYNVLRKEKQAFKHNEASDRSLFLYKKELLTHPFLYLSEFFEENRQDYYALLSGASELNDIESWIKFSSASK